MQQAYAHLDGLNKSCICIDNPWLSYASNGMSLGEAEDVDVIIDGLKGQCKMRKKIASFMKPPESCDIALIKEDREDTLVVIRYQDFLNIILKQMGEW